MTTYRYRHEKPRVNALGNSDGGISEHLKCWISHGTTFICGIVGEGSTVDIQSNWNVPFEGASAAGVAGMVNGAVQLGTGKTLRNAFSTTQIWAGNEPIDISLNMLFYALNDPEGEVEQAIEGLRKLISPELRDIVPFGQSPQPVMLNLRRRLILPRCVIKSVSESFDATVDSNGARLSAAVQVSLSTERTVSRSEL